MGRRSAKEERTPRARPGAPHCRAGTARGGLGRVMLFMGGPDECAMRDAGAARRARRQRRSARPPRDANAFSLATSPLSPSVHTHTAPGAETEPDGAPGAWLTRGCGPARGRCEFELGRCSLQLRLCLSVWEGGSLFLFVACSLLARAHAMLRALNRLAGPARDLAAQVTPRRAMATHSSAARGAEVRREKTIGRATRPRRGPTCSPFSIFSPWPRPGRSRVLAGARWGGQHREASRACG